MKKMLVAITAAFATALMLSPGITDPARAPSTAAAEAPGSPAQLVCPTDDSPHRVQVIYAHNGDNSRWPDVHTEISDVVAGAQRIFDQSSVWHGADHSLVPRFEAAPDGDGSCRLALAEMQIERVHEYNFFAYITEEMARNGFNDPRVTYLLLHEEKPSGFVNCGMGRMEEDANPDPNANANNNRDSAFDAHDWCWDSVTSAHELAHTFGAVQPSAPHSDGEAHCDDNAYDLMCEGAGPRDTTCPHGLVDCGRDDYFDPTYDTAGYLATHWNIADSWWLMPVPNDATSPDTTPPGPFVDVPGDHTFASNIAALADSGITRGCNPPTNDRFCPDAPLTRGQMAAFLDRALGLPDGDSTFADAQGHTFERNIAALADAGITRGCNPPTNDRFCPDATVTRAQMAAFLDRAGLTD